MNDLPFARLTSLELHDLFESGYVKLNNIIRDSELPNHIKTVNAIFSTSYTRKQLLCKR